MFVCRVLVCVIDGITQPTGGQRIGERKAVGACREAVHQMMGFEEACRTQPGFGMYGL